MKPIQRSRPLQIYMKPGIRDDELLLRVWDACTRLDRPQDVFRSMLKRGLISMIESGDMPDAVIDECDLDVIAERKRRKSGRAQKLEHEHAPPVYAPAMPVAQPQAYYPYPVPSAPSPQHHQFTQHNEHPGKASETRVVQPAQDNKAAAPPERSESTTEAMPQKTESTSQPQKNEAKASQGNFSGDTKRKLSPDLM